MNYIELIKLGFAAIKEILNFTRQNQSSVNIEATVNEIEGKLYAMEGYTEKIKLENDDLKVDKVRLSNELKEVRHELEQLQKYLKGE